MTTKSRFIDNGCVDFLFDKGEKVCDKKSGKKQQKAPQMFKKCTKSLLKIVIVKMFSKWFENTKFEKPVFTHKHNLHKNPKSKPCNMHYNATI